MSKGFVYWGKRFAFEPEISGFFNHADVAIPYDNTVYHAATAQEITGIQWWTHYNNFVRDLKTFFALPFGSLNLQDYVPVFLPTLGGTALKHKRNMSNTTRWNMLYAGGWTHGPTGADPDGTSGYCYLDTNLYFGGIVYEINMQEACFGIDLHDNVDGLYLDMYGQDGARPDIFAYARNGGNILHRLDSGGVNNSHTIAQSNGMLFLAGMSTTSYKVIQEGVDIATQARSNPGLEAISNPLQRGLSGVQWPLSKHSGLMVLSGMTYTLTDIQDITTLYRDLQTITGR